MCLGHVGPRTCSAERSRMKERSSVVMTTLGIAVLIRTDHKAPPARSLRQGDPRDPQHRREEPHRNKRSPSQTAPHSRRRQRNPSISGAHDKRAEKLRLINPTKSMAGSHRSGRIKRYTLRHILARTRRDRQVPRPQVIIRGTASGSKINETGLCGHLFESPRDLRML